MAFFCSSGSSSPPQFDASSAVNAQTDANRLAQFTPQGNLLFGNVNSQGGFDQKNSGSALYVEESPFQETIRVQNENISKALADRAGQQVNTLPTAPITFDGLPDYQAGIDRSGVGAVPTADSFSEDASRVEQATYDRAMGLLNPQLDLQERRLRQSLANQGIPASAEAASGDLGELTRFDRTRNEAFSNAALDAVQAGRSEQSRLYGQALSSRSAQLGDLLTDQQLNNQARAQGFGEKSAMRTNQYNELAALLGGGQVSPVGVGSFVQPGQVDVMTPLQMQQQAGLAAFNASQQQQAANTGGLFGLGSTALAAALLG